jgi:hypothetical protein
VAEIERPDFDPLGEVVLGVETDTLYAGDPILSDKAVELNFADSVSLMTVHRVLKKTNFSLTAANTGKFPQKEVRRL